MALVDLFGSEMVLGFAKVVIVLTCLVPIIYFVTKWYAKVHRANTTVNVKERVPLGNNRFLYVIEWAGNHYLLAITNQQIEMIDKQIKSLQADEEVPTPALGEGGE
ncbi:MAG TPA: flagellar biosynthetic protein FliO [Firmicutes bacterium]|nr:flagellar biosynthetic protein FliO [Bacillota bacterium]